MIAERIQVEYWAKPIPYRDHDYCATFPDYYDGAPDAGPQLVGYGATAYAAIVDLLLSIDDAPSQPQEPARGDGATMPLADWVV